MLLPWCTELRRHRTIAQPPDLPLCAVSLARGQRENGAVTHEPPTHRRDAIGRRLPASFGRPTGTQTMRVIRNIWLGPLALLAAVAVVSAPAAAQQQRPNIVIIWGDDIGLSDVSAYSQGLMGFHTPNIDRIAREGVLFTDGHLEK
jgi:hypothetical protein